VPKVEDGSSSSFQAAGHRSSSSSFPAADHRSSSSFPAAGNRSSSFSAASHDILSLVPKKRPSETSDKRKTEGQHEKEGKIEEERQTDTRERKGEEREEGERKPVESLAGEREHRVPNISALRYVRRPFLVPL
jgi:hypothetical protein